MLNNFLGKRYRHKRYNYEPRYYDPSKDNRIRERMRVQSSTRRGRGGNILGYILLLCAILYLLVTLS